MKNALALAALIALSACTDPVATDAEIHQPVNCDDNWAGYRGFTYFASCELPCVDHQQLGSRAACTSGGMACAPGQFSDWMGREGCCVVEGSPDAAIVKFAECDGG